MKIHSFDEASQSLIVSYASDRTRSQNPNDYQTYAYQPAQQWPDITDPYEIKKRIAQAGMYITEQQRLREAFEENQANIEIYKSMVGHTVEHTEEELIALTNPNVVVDVPTQELVTSETQLKIIEV